MEIVWIRMNMSDYYTMSRKTNTKFNLVSRMNIKLSHNIYAKGIQNLRLRIIYMGG